MSNQAIALKKEEKHHLQQLARDLVQGDANLPSGTPLNSTEGFDQIPYIVKQVFQAGRQDAFSDYLSSFIVKKEVEIERMCGLHYQEFVQSVDQLLKVRAGTSTIKDRIIAMNQGIAIMGDKVVEKKRELVDNRQKLLNVELTLEAVQACLFVLDISNRISIQIASKKYFSALRMIQELQSSHLKLVRGYTFSKMIVNWLPLVQDAVRESVLRDLKEWFASIKKGAPKIGKMALGLTALRQQKASDIMSAKVHASSPKGLNQAQSMDVIIAEELNESALDNESAELDFTAIFQCIHIHDVLGKRVQLKLEFDESRRLQAEVILHTPILPLALDDIRGFEKYIQEIAGFFVIEATIISTTQDFRSRTSVEMLWQTCTNKMNAHLFDALSECTNPDLYLNIKVLVNSFISTMEIYGYAVNSLTDLLESLLDRYAELMKNRYSNFIIQIIEEDDYGHLIVRDAEELDEINNSYVIPDEVLKQNLTKRDYSVTFPKTLPFSSGFPKICKYVREMVQGFYKFADGFSQQNHEIDDLLKKTLENLLQGINNAYIEKLANSGISVVYQLMINLTFCESACEQFESLLVEKRSSARTIRSFLLSTNLFAETRQAAEQRIHSIINDKNASFLELVDYDWKVLQPRRQASPYLNELVTFLTTVMTSTLADLSPKAKGHLYFEAFDHLATTIKTMILSPKIEHITLSALETVEYDVLFLEKACSKLQEAHAQDSFAELKQLIAYGRSEKYEDLAQPSVKNKKYTRVEAKDAIILLEKKGGVCQPIQEMASLFLETLRQAELDAYYGSLTAYGVRSVESLMQLTMQDYGVVGVHSMEDRKRLFQLIQTLKTDFSSADGVTARPAAAMPIKQRTSITKPSTSGGPTAIQMSTRSRSIDIVSAPSGQEDLSKTKLYEKHPRHSIGSDDDHDESPPSFRKLARSVPSMASSPKQSRSTLNAYGVPNSFPSSLGATQKRTSMGDLSDRIRVCVRKRPLSKKELKRGESDIARVSGRRTITILEPKVKVDLTKYVETHEFVFDEAFDADSTNDDVYKRTAYPLVEYIFDGGKATCFAYGQTGSGKTYTMLDSTNGLYVKAGRDIFTHLKQPANAHLSAWVSFYEIYQGHLYDLLGNRKKLYAREDGKQQVIIKGIQEYEVDKVDRLMQIFEAGNATRSTGATGANADSSRSHAIFQIVLKHKGKKEKVQGKLSFIDLAGSERGADRGETDRQTRMEGSEINKSLLALKECIRALDQDSRHTPFRQSKLTQVLKDSFIGNSRTCMIATMTPNMSNSEHSLNTLRYADRVKELKGSSSYDGDDFEGDEPGMDNEFEDDTMKDDEEHGLLIDEEFPPSTFPSDQPMDDDSDPAENFATSQPKSSSARSSLLSQLNKKPLLPRLNSDSHHSSRANSSESLDLKGMATALNPRNDQFMDELIKSHRAHIRESTESGKQESKLLVNLTMKMGKNHGDRSTMIMTFDNYVRELDDMVKKKLDSLIELQAKINQHLNG